MVCVGLVFVSNKMQFHIFVHSTTAQASIQVEPHPDSLHNGIV